MADAAISIAVPDEYAQRARWRAFLDPSVEASYRDWHRAEILPGAQVVAIGAGVLWGLIPVVFYLIDAKIPREVVIGSWAIGAPLCFGAAAVTYTAHRRRIVELILFTNVVLGLDFIWAMSNMYGSTSGIVASGVLAFIFYPMIFRIPTGTTAIAAVILTAVPVWLWVNGVRHGDVGVSESWTSVAVLATSSPLIVVAAALYEAGMRQQFAAQRQLQASQRLLRRYVPEQVADAVLSNRSEAVARHERRKLTIFFSDLVGFTDLSDEMEPEDLATVLHDYFTEMSAIAQKHAGTVDDLIGDAVLVLFGAPDFTDDRDQALRAVRMAVEMQEAMEALNDRWASAGIPETLTVRMGINTGVATVGNFGSAERTKYTALGKQVNVAARIQSHCEPGKVLIGHTTWLLVRDEVDCTAKGELELKGLRKPMPAYEVKTTPA